MSNIKSIKLLSLYTYVSILCEMMEQQSYSWTRFKSLGSNTWEKQNRKNHSKFILQLA